MYDRSRVSQDLQDQRTYSGLSTISWGNLPPDNSILKQRQILSGIGEFILGNPRTRINEP